MVAVETTEDGAVLTIASELTYYDQVSEPAAYETVRVANPSLPVGTEKVVQEGADGVRTSIYEVIWSGGEEISRQFVEELESTAVNRVIEYGTGAVETRAAIASVSKNADGSGTLTLTDGSTLNFSGVKVHDRHRLHRRARRRGLHHRHRHPGGYGHRGRGQERHSPGHQAVYRGRGRLRGLRQPPWRRTPASGATSSTCTTTPISSASTSAGGPATSIS